VNAHDGGRHVLDVGRQGRDGFRIEPGRAGLRSGRDERGQREQKHGGETGGPGHG
jgi:hypothetical protein